MARKYLTEQEALSCLERNNVKHGFAGKDRLIVKISVIRPVGLKVWSAIDCLLNHCRGYRLAR